jgi:hypothetical protein
LHCVVPVQVLTERFTACDEFQAIMAGTDLTLIALNFPSS